MDEDIKAQTLDYLPKIKKLIYERAENLGIFAPELILFHGGKIYIHCLSLSLPFVSL